MSELPEGVEIEGQVWRVSNWSKYLKERVMEGYIKNLERHEDALKAENAKLRKAVRAHLNAIEHGSVEDEQDTADALEALTQEKNDE